MGHDPELVQTFGLEKDNDILAKLDYEASSA